jgi:hypothetical protein
VPLALALKASEFPQRVPTAADYIPNLGTASAPGNYKSLIQDIIDLAAGSDAPSAGSYFTRTSETGLSNESNLGTLTTGLLKITVSAGVATPSTAAAGTDYQAADATLTDIADGTIAENLVNTANPWADNEVADTITASNYLLLSAIGAAYDTSAELDALFAATQPLEATLTDIADGTITENLVNTANPWADNEVADTITASNYLPLSGLGTGVQTALADDAETAGGISVIVAKGTSALGTSAIASGACATVVTTAATGTATTDIIDWGFNSDPTGVVGYQPSVNGMLTIIAYPSTNNVNFKVCNNTAASITPGVRTLNWKVQR